MQPPQSSLGLTERAVFLHKISIYTQLCQLFLIICLRKPPAMVFKNIRLYYEDTLYFCGNNLHIKNKYYDFISLTISRATLIKCCPYCDFPYFFAIFTRAVRFIQLFLYAISSKAAILVFCLSSIILTKSFALARDSMVPVSSQANPRPRSFTSKSSSLR